MSVGGEVSGGFAVAMAPRSRVPLWLLAVLTFTGTLAMHIFVPALPIAAADLGATPAAMQMTISLYILGLAFGQLVYGPLADRFGRRSVLMVGLTIYSAASLAAALAPGATSLIALRLLQALGGCAGLVLARAIVRDTAAPSEAARRLALMNLMVTLGPGLAPIVGSFLATELGWRSIFLLLCLLGITNLTLTWRLLPETRQATAGGGAGVARNYLRLLKSPAFLGYALGGGCATTSLYGFVAAVPFILVEQLHRPTYEVGVSLAILILGVWVGSAVASHLITRLPIGRLLVGANALSVVAAAVLLVAALSGHLSLALTIGPMFVFTLGAGTASPAALTQAISVNPHVVGSASGLYGAAQMAVGALCTSLVSIGSDHALSAALVLTAAGLIAQLSFWIALRRRPAEDPDKP
ncbi:MFS transporter, DHA1 family, bicyclomycin/chloramphenicol resistance protein [Tistlia consotensis]|uniref:Bcr/CflA family efflux transporter n=1 Tax=Tistlia consotensis USBA 355 TaxID=560819 RepID=A0A1Y6B8F0_9PROT|nr:multidrug effflux MFS transporter [Tistlia consotensis]SME90876.1 MFS transporter, DHA1 family, bicyclomycin/chloramphenicol resistance protein [Tistlia consotensis USBA 355]SNR26979.1 MFS transporter, DHA1 family, bicyclomycin/chloramphenicol resistance protein [Tistlia consotensis]